jgi:hypothetical protein
MMVHRHDSQSLQRADWLPRSVLAGFTASVLMGIAFFIAYGLAVVLGSVTLASRRGAEELQTWLVALTHNPLIDVANAALYAAGAMHLAVGVLLALVYGSIAEPRLPGPGWSRGIVFAMVPWLLSLTLAFPLLGAGFFGAALGAGPLPAIGNLVLHLVYGASLGAIYGPLGDIPADSFSATAPRDDTETTAAFERAGAIGVMLGAPIGAAVGIIGTRLPGALSPENGLAPAFALVFGTAVLGAAFGAAVGPFLSVARSETTIRRGE